MIWRCRDREFDLSGRTLVMGVVNVTPDSFSDGGRYFAPGAAVAHARRLLAEGADLLDLGAESTRPGAAPVTAAEQIRRLAPVLEALAGEPGACVAVDTASAQVAEYALERGARIVNDVTALADPGMAERVAAAGAGLVLMHMAGTPATMQRDPRYEDVAREVARTGSPAGWPARAPPASPPRRSRSTPASASARRSSTTCSCSPGSGSCPGPAGRCSSGVSRKSFLGKILDLPVDQRLEGGLAAGGGGRVPGRARRAHARRRGHRARRAGRRRAARGAAGVVGPAGFCYSPARPRPGARDHDARPPDPGCSTCSTSSWSRCSSTACSWR